MPSISNTIALLLGLVAISPQVADAAALFSRNGGGNWGVNATWSNTGCPGGANAGASPGAGDTVTICAGDTVTMNASPGAASSLTISGTATWNLARTTNVGAGGVIVNAGGDIAGAGAGVLTSTGGLTINAVTTSTTVAVTLQTTAGQSISGTGSLANLTANATATNSGTLTVRTALAGTSTLTNTGTLNLGGTSAITGLTANTAANTVNYTGAAQTVKQPTAGTYATLGLSGSGAKAMTGITSITGDLNVSGTATMTSNAALTLTGALNYGSTGATTLSAATPVSIGTYNQSAGTLTDNGNTITVTGTGANTWTKTAGTFTATGTANFTGAAPQIGASNFNTLQISVGSGNTATLTGTATPSGNLTVSSGTLDLATFTANRTAVGGTLTVAANATLKIGGTNTFPTSYTAHALNATSTIEYSGTNQSVAAEGAPGFGNLTFGGNSTKTAANGFTVRGALTIGSGVTFAGTTFNVTVNGNVSNAGTHTASTGTITLSGGSAAHTLSGTGTYANLVMNDANGATLGASPAVSGVLTFTSGVISTGANALITSATCPGSVSRTSGHVSGNLQLKFATGASTCTFDVGDGAAASYAPVAVAFANVTVGGSLIGSTIATDYSDPGIPIDTAKSVNRYWTLTLPGSGALSFGGAYDINFTYLSADNDPATTPSQYGIARGDACAPNCTWALSNASGTPTSTSAAAPSQTSFSVFAVGQKRVTHFTVGVPGSVSTCNAGSITITALDKNNNTVTNYSGTVNIMTSTLDGDWSLTTGGGTLTNSGTAASGVLDDGQATYAFVNADNGVVVLSLANVQVNSDVTVTVVDDADATTSTTSSAIQYRGNQFVIGNDAIQVAFKPQAMTITRQRGASCTTTLNEYAGNKNLKAWYTTDADHPAGATAPAITGASPAITTAVPGANNLTLNFTAGAASFTLTTTDVGKYVINMRDDASGTVDGTSPTITTRPFALVVTGIKQGGTDNPSGTATAGSRFAAAGTSFQATVGGYLWSAAADANSDGDPEGGATLAQITAAGLAPRFAWATTLAAAAPITPAAGTLGSLANGALTSGAFSGGAATPNNLDYSEVGSFTLTASSTSFLNTAGADYTIANGRAIIFDSGAARNGVVGRMFPDHFTLLSGSTITPGCASGGFTYEGQPALAYSFTIEARNAANAKTSNYRSADYTVGTVTIQAEDSNNGSALSSRLTGPAGSWSSGSYASANTDTFARAASPDGPFDSLQLGVQVTDTDGPVLDARDMDQTTSAACTPATCTGQSIGGAATKVRFGRLRLQNASGPQNIDLPIPIQTEYWNGSVFTLNSVDGCTSLSSANLSLGSYSGGISGANMGNSHITLGGAFLSGVGSLKLTKPSPPATTPGAATLTVDLTAEGKTYLQGAWGGGTYTFNPSARATFGLFGSQPQNFIYQRENY